MTGIVQSLIGSFGSVVSAVTDAYFNLVTLLLPGNGTNGAQNNTFLDSGTANSGSGFTITRNGQTTQGTFSPFSQTGWGYYLNGASNYLSIADNAAFNFGTGNFCVEFWINAPNQTTSYPGIISSSDYNGALSIRYDNTGYDNKIFVYMGGGGDPVIASTSTIANNTWAHVAVVRDSTTSLKIYINGVQDATATISASLATDLSVGPLYIGRGFDVDGANAYFTGYISNLRVTKGGAVYTTGFTPSTTPLTTTVPSGTVSLLTCQSNRFIDNSTANSGSGFAITVNGTPSVQAFSPFAPTAAYDAATNGGSGYFDGNGDVLNAGSNAAWAFGTGNFTVECWCYLTSFTNNRMIIVQGTTTFGLWVNSSGQPLIDNVNVGALLTSSISMPLNAWTHIAAVRSGTTLAIYVNGASGGTVTNSTNFGQNTLYIGGDGVGYYTAGYLSGVRILKGTAQYTAAFTPPTSPPTNITNTSLLLNFTNAGITDATAKNDLETVGNAQISTTQSKFGGSSMYFDGTGDYLTIPSGAILALGTGAYTIEFWINPSSLSATASHIIGANATNGLIVLATNAKLALNKYGVGDVLAYNSALSTSTWTHVAIVREGTGTNQTKIYVNGTSVATGTDSNDWTVTSFFGIGANTTNGTQTLTGYIDDLRITRGYARYTSNFAAPTAAFPLQ